MQAADPGDATFSVRAPHKHAVGLSDVLLHVRGEEQVLLHVCGASSEQPESARPHRVPQILLCTTSSRRLGCRFLRLLQAGCCRWRADRGPSAITRTASLNDDVVQARLVDGQVGAVPRVCGKAGGQHAGRHPPDDTALKRASLRSARTPRAGPGGPRTDAGLADVNNHHLQRAATGRGRQRAPPGRGLHCEQRHEAEE